MFISVLSMWIAKAVSMKLPFTIEQFLGVFKSYNETIFPLQIFFYLMAGTIVFLSLKTSAWSDKIINSILAFFWLWMGIAYHILFFSTINKSAYLFSKYMHTKSSKSCFFFLVAWLEKYYVNCGPESKGIPGC